MSNDCNELRKQYETETGKKWMTNPVCHGEMGFASWDYQIWLENHCWIGNKQPLPEPERMDDDIANALNELQNVIPENKALSTRSEGWATDEDMRNAYRAGRKGCDDWDKDNTGKIPSFNKWLTDYKLKKGK